jgi:hypothetical protein
MLGTETERAQLSPPDSQPAPPAVNQNTTASHILLPPRVRLHLSDHLITLSFRRLLHLLRPVARQSAVTTPHTTTTPPQPRPYLPLPGHPVQDGPLGLRHDGHTVRQAGHGHRAAAAAGQKGRRGPGRHQGEQAPEWAVKVWEKWKKDGPFLNHVEDWVDPDGDRK